MSDTKDEAYDAYKDGIRSRVCSVCLDQKDDGTCGVDRRTCALEALLPAIVEAVLAVESDRMADYEAAIRALVFPSCGSEDARGRCRVRDSGECALDTYLFLVVDAQRRDGVGEQVHMPHADEAIGRLVGHRHRQRYASHSVRHPQRYLRPRLPAPYGINRLLYPTPEYPTGSERIADAPCARA